MRALALSLLVLALALASVVTADNSSDGCPLWHYRDHEEMCKCGHSLNGAVICSDDGVYLRVDYTMTWNNSTNQVVAALNRYGHHNNSNMQRRVYSLMPSDIAELNRTCTLNHREGFLCEKCRPGYGPNTYMQKCMKCSEHFSGIALYLTIKLLPIVILFVLIMTFRINITQGPMLGYVLYCQVHIIAARQVATFYQILLMEQKGFRIVMETSLFLSGIWDLDFFLVTTIIPSFCISDKLWDLDVLLLNFMSVLFPLCLMILTYICIELHARNFRMVTFCWKPFHTCFAKVRRNWSATDSTIHAYATLLFLSFTTLNFNAFEILRSTNVFQVDGVAMRNVLVNHPSIHVYCPKYIYYLTVVLFLVFFIGICPSLLLLLYPIRLLRTKLLRCCSQRIQIGLNTFVETYQGCFKDGLDGTRDYRMLPGCAACVILFGNMFSCLAHVVDYNTYLTPTFVGISALGSVFFAYIRPCKSSITNLSLTFHCMWVAALGALLTLWWQDMDMDSRWLALLFVIFTPIPHVLMILWVLYKLETNVLHIHQRCTNCYCFVLGQKMFGKLWDQDNTPLLPDRLLNSQEYRELN